MKRAAFVVALALVGFACADSVGQMLVDAGTSMQDGSVPDAGAQPGVLNLTCDTVIESDSGGFDRTTYYARVEASELPGPFNVYTCPVEKPQFQNVRAECYSLADFGHTITDDGAHWFDCGSCTSNCPRYEPHTLRIVR